MKTEMNKGQQVYLEEHKTILQFDQSNRLWNVWTSHPEHVEKFVGDQWELVKVDAEGMSFTAPEHALQLHMTNGKKLTGKERRERVSNLYRAQVHEIIERRHREQNGK